MSAKPRNEFQNPDEFLEWYRDHRWFHSRLARLVAQFLEWRVEQQFNKARLPLLAKVTHREKTLVSLRGRLNRLEPEQSQKIEREAFGDLAGVRVVFYFRNDVESFCNNPGRLFEQWFGKYSQDHLDEKGRAGETTKRGKARGYRAFHFPVKVTPHSEFWEYLNEVDKKFLEGLYCEVQLRTTLQDAWAEAEHDLRYKLERGLSTTSTEEDDENFENLAITLREADAKLAHLKDEFLKRRSSRTGPVQQVEQSWKYAVPLMGATKIAGILYAYELLHEKEDRSGPRAPFSIQQSQELFDVDAAMEQVAGIKQYKHLMWESLRQNEPQFIASITYDGMAVRATDWQADLRTLKVQLASYSDQVVTNHKKALIQQLPNDVTRKVQDLSKDASGAFLPFSRSPFSNTVGVACVAKVEDYWMIGLRSSAVAFDPGSWGCSASGALNWTELGAWERRDFDGWFKAGLIREFEEEIGYRPLPADVHYLGLAREVGRAGKPQIFFYVNVKSRCDRLTSIFRTYKTSQAEYQRIEFLDQSKARDLVSDSERLVQSVAGEFGVSEELRFNLALAIKHENSI